MRQEIPLSTQLQAAKLFETAVTLDSTEFPDSMTEIACHIS
jgi:hypothetical protein